MWIYSIFYLYLCMEYAFVFTESVFMTSSKLISRQHNHNFKIRRREYPENVSDSTINASDSSDIQCTPEQMNNLEWLDQNNGGFLCGPKSLVNGYSVTMLPQGMHFYHGSKTLPHGVIPGGETNGMQQIKKKLLGCLLLVNMEKK